MHERSEFPHHVRNHLLPPVIPAKSSRAAHKAMNSDNTTAVRNHAA